MARIILPTFAKGEISPALHGRVDIGAYGAGLAKARNAIVHTYGGVSKRPGTQFLGPVADHSYAPRLLPFVFKTTDQYILEFGDQYMRVIRDNGHVLTGEVNITGISKASPAVVTVASHTFANGDEVYIADVGGMIEVNQNRYIVANQTATTFELTSQVTGADIDSTGFTTYTSGGTVAAIYEISTPYASADVINLKYAQSADVMTLTHPSYAIQKLSRVDHDDWTLEEATFGPVIDTPADMVLTVDGADNNITYQYRVTAIDRETQEESLPGLEDTEDAIEGITKADPGVITVTGHVFETGDEIQIDNIVGMVELNARRFLVVDASADTITLTDIDGTAIDTTAYTTYVSGGIIRRTFVKTTDGSTNPANTITWTAVSGAARYAVYRLDNGIYGLIGETEIASFTDSNESADLTVSPPQNRNPFFETDDFPGAVGFFEQRQVYGGSVNEPDTIEYSQTGRYDNFNRSFPQQSDDAITALLSSNEVNDIRHFVPLNDLLVFTSGAEWRVASGLEVAFTFETLRQKPQSQWGSSHIRPVLLGNSAIFITDDSAGVRSIGYSFSLDGYTGGDLTLLSSHFVNGFTISDMCAAQYPDGRLYMPRSDGQLLTMSFDQDQEVNAWTSWDTDGKFERSAKLTHQGDSGEDIVYFVIRRIVDGNIVRYIEFASERFFDDVRDCFFVDSGLSEDVPLAIEGITLADPGVITVTGHGLLNGDEVDISDIVWVPDTDAYGNLVQPDQLNDGRYTVANKTTDTFTLQDEDGVDIDTTDFNAWLEGGYVRLAFSIFRGLDHLEGKTIVALCDGDVVKDLTVSGGAITLPRSYSRVHAGLPYVCDINTLNLERGEGTMQGIPSKVSKLTMRFFKSRGMFFGPDVDHLFEMKQREFENIGEPTRLLSGDKEVVMSPQWQKNGCRVWLRHIDPLPMTLLALIPDIELGDN